MGELLENIGYINHLIDIGQASRARGALGEIKTVRLGRDARFQLASAARRAGLPFLTLRLLSPQVRPSTKNPFLASEREKAEYAAALIKVGAAREALEILKDIDPSKVPQVLLYTAHALFTQWDYAASIPVLEKYLKFSLDDTQRIIGKVNLASALVHERFHERAEKSLRELEGETREKGMNALYGNTLERLAELNIQKHQWANAEAHLREAERAVQEAGGFDVFFVEKWRSILWLYRKPKANLEKFLQFQSEAHQRGHWETVRDCDAHRAIVCRDENLLRKVYFGTPYSSYRERLLRDYGSKIELGDGYWLRLENSKSPEWDPFRSSELKFSQLKHRLLRALTSDFYRPFRVAHLFSEVYPDEGFRVGSSRARIYVGIRELKGWLKKKNVGFTVAEKMGEYRLAPLRSPAAIFVPGVTWWRENSLPGLEKLRKKTKEKSFVASDLARWLSLPRRTAFEWLRKGLALAVFEKSGAGRTTRYQFL